MGDPRIDWDDSSSHLSFDVTGLSPGMSYSFRVTAANQFGVRNSATILTVFILICKQKIYIKKKM